MIYAFFKDWMLVWPSLIINIVFLQGFLNTCHSANLEEDSIFLPQVSFEIKGRCLTRKRYVRKQASVIFINTTYILLMLNNLF